ncbi:hypothetical protein EW146_g3139 [Bondarzewia mesenterica]|uniref:DASH complex subunit DUO1 n=1 Tax=Bondarzewia mesenterica TaxID=1095465 RepID=A0A4S4LYK1_9AGAM|nr:hypothetical protein EW146_g3139 [Bondarzewia mesenterica]
MDGLDSSTHTGHGGDDLSLSELSATDHPKPFSLIAQPLHPENIDDENGIFKAVEIRQSEERARENKLQNDLFILRKLNAAFGLYTEALSTTHSSTERVAVQLEQTNALLDKYVNILIKSEAVTRLVFDERWAGAEEDEDMLEREEREAEELRRREDQERALAAQREVERREREEQEREARQEKHRVEGVKTGRSVSRSTSGVRGVRGTRASMRSAAQTASRSVSTRTNNSITQVGSGKISTTASKIGRPSLSVSTRGSTVSHKLPRQG